MFSKKNLLRILINTLIGVGLIFFWLQVVDLEEVLKEINQVKPIYLLPPVFIFFLANLIRSLRLKLLLSEYRISFKDVLFLNGLSQLLSFTIPIRAGEVAKGVYLSTQFNIKFPKALVWIFLDRFLDFWFVLVLSLILLGIIPTNLPSNLTQSLLILVSVFSIGLVLVYIFPDFIKKLSVLFSNLLVFSKLKKFFITTAESVIDGAQFLKRGFAKTSGILSLTILATIVDASAWTVLFLGFDQTEPFLKTLLGSMLSALTYLIPAAPGYVGSAEASGLAVFHYGLGMDKTLISATTLLYHGLTLIYMLVFGLMSLYSLKFDLSLVWKQFKKN